MELQNIIFLALWPLPAHGGTGLGLSDSAVTESMNAGRLDGDLLGIGAIITADYF